MNGRCLGTEKQGEGAEILETLMRLRVRVIVELNNANGALPSDMWLRRGEIHRIADELVCAVQEASRWRRTKSPAMTSLRRRLLSLTRPARRWRYAWTPARSESGPEQTTGYELSSVRDSTEKSPDPNHVGTPSVGKAKSLPSSMGQRTSSQRNGDGSDQGDNLTDLR